MEEKYYADDEDALDMRKTLKAGLEREKAKEKAAEITNAGPVATGKKKKGKEKTEKKEMAPLPDIEEENKKGDKKKAAPKKKKNKK